VPRDLYVVSGGICSRRFSCRKEICCRLLLCIGYTDPTEATTEESAGALRGWLVVLGCAYMELVICAGFFAPYDPAEQDRQKPGTYRHDAFTSWIANGHLTRILLLFAEKL